MGAEIIGVGLGGFIMLSLVYLVMRMALGVASAGKDSAQHMFKLGGGGGHQQTHNARMTKEEKLIKHLDNI